MVRRQPQPPLRRHRRPDPRRSRRPRNRGEGEGREAYVGCLHQQPADSAAEILAGGVRGGVRGASQRRAGGSGGSHLRDREDVDADDRSRATATEIDDFQNEESQGRGRHKGNGSSREPMTSKYEVLPHVYYTSG